MTPKREFRGAWLHTVFQEQYLRNGTERNKAYLRSQLDSLAAMGVNAVIFQVRPQADSFYASKLEPWSCYLTKGGKAPVPFWDPLEFMIAEAHARGLELHAWLNPYRVTSNTRQISALPKNHIYHSHPERFVNYGGKLYFDPALPENREHIGRVVDDIVARYDVDGIHFDDYFYPYPIPGKKFPDSKSYAKYGKGMKLADWRRHNVDLLIEDIHRRIRAAKPWVRFGISPFGIYRNKTSDPAGSDTRGLENYDALYADVLLWARKGWIDYLMPQLYWELEHKAASYLVLVDWWAGVDVGKCHIYVGQDVERTMTKPDLAPSPLASQLNRKLALTRATDRIQGVCWWPGYALSRNIRGVADSLATSLHSSSALVPDYPQLCADAPAPVTDIRPGSASSFSWKAAPASGSASDAIRFAVYRFTSRHEIDIDDASALVGITADTHFDAPGEGVYVVTALSRVNVESKPSAPIYIK
ncbi:MAG: family 10 glycosylhydrolase [Muribaculaceae bacterium]|nr:family 10 glycosylhydrolase [Muribaculaceae bacterium]